jgi:hypothetical protein
MPIDIRPRAYFRVDVIDIRPDGSQEPVEGASWTEWGTYEVNAEWAGGFAEAADAAATAILEITATSGTSEPPIAAKATFVDERVFDIGYTAA